MRLYRKMLAFSRAVAKVVEVIDDIVNGSGKLTDIAIVNRDACANAVDKIADPGVAGVIHGSAIGELDDEADRLPRDAAVHGRDEMHSGIAHGERAADAAAIPCPSGRPSDVTHSEGPMMGAPVAWAIALASDAWSWWECETRIAAGLVAPS